MEKPLHSLCLVQQHFIFKNIPVQWLGDTQKKRKEWIFFGIVWLMKKVFQKTKNKMYFLYL